MSRSRKESPADVLFDLIAALPWWVGAVLAVLSYLLLHRLATQPLAVSVAPDQAGQNVVKAVVSGLSMAGQYIVPIICLAAAAGSALRRRKRRELIGKVTSSPAVGALDEMSWREFEMLVAESFRLNGYQVAETGGGGADGGIDLVLKKDGETYLVQCKQWKALKVGVPVVRELFGVMAAKGAAGGFVVTSGRFTAEAEEFASGRNLTLMDGPNLKAMINQVQGSRASSASSRASAPRPSELTSTPVASIPACPRCGGDMVMRRAKRGANAGSSFWGCGTYPNCKGVRAI